METVARARDIVAHSLMSDLSKEDPQGHDEYQDALRHQVVSVFQRLRLSLFILDTLVVEYNSSK